ncbi:MAG TPA: YjbH domain-containing protein [Acetobacteraceae bacterium]|nr:YjbH domain-containing protein [Acetobacteraceae bacterium]
MAPAARAQDEPASSGGALGGAGLIEMRNARFHADGTLEAGVSLRHQRRFYFASFQALPWLEATFRVAERLDGTDGRGMTNDRALDLRTRIWEETDWRPALAIGFQDVLGTGIYGGEYVVASKRVWDFDLTFGVGWGRLGTGADIANPLRYSWEGFATRRRDVGSGGTLAWRSFFRGEQAALFGGVEWSVPPVPTPFGTIEGLRAKVEWSGDALRDERGGYPARTTGLRGQARSRVNLGLQWSNEWLDAGVFLVHGTDLLVRVSARLDAHRPPEAPRRPPPVMEPRPAAGGDADDRDLAARLFPALRAAGFRPVSVAVEGAEARIAVSGGRHRTLAQVAGRVMRVAQPFLPAAVERVTLAWMRDGVEIARLAVLRGAMEGAASGFGSAEELFAHAQLLAPASGFAEGARAPGPSFDWGIEPRLRMQFGDPRLTLGYQASLAAGARIGLGWGVSIAGSLQQVVAQNLDRGAPSDSLLPRVRSDYARYAREGRDLAIPTLYAEGLWTAAPDVFVRATAGLLEPMFAGVSGEVLWRPRERPFAIGLDIAGVQQRAFDQRFATRDHRVTTGHLSVYADLPWWNLYAVVRAGRYLAGDWGATIEIGRRFDSGIEVGAFATVTDVPARRFGEGSFDKGIYVRFPLDLFGVESRSIATALIRPVQRDGGQRLAVDNPLWELTRDGREDAFRRGVGWWLR